MHLCPTSTAQSELVEAAQGALHQARLLIAAVRNSGYRLVSIHIKLAPLTKAISVLCVSHKTFIFKTLALKTEMSMLKVLKGMQSSLLLQSGPEKKYLLTKKTPKYSILYPHAAHI